MAGDAIDGRKRFGEWKGGEIRFLCQCKVSTRYNYSMP